MMARRVAVVACVMLLCGGLPARAAGPTLPSLNLRPSDVPHGFSRHINRLMNNTQAAQANNNSVATYNRQGRVLTDEVDYVREALSGLLVIDSEISVFHTAAQAHLAYVAAVRAGGQMGLGSLTVSRIGQERTGYTFTELGDAVGRVLFRRDNYEVLVGVVGIAHTFDLSQVNHFAGIVDHRLPRTATPIATHGGQGNS